MDKNGQPEPLIFHPYFSAYKPFMSLDKLVSQVPSVRKQFVNYQEYTKIRDIKDFTQLDPADIVEYKQLNELRSMVYLSKEGQYIGQPLPMEAQMSSLQGIIANEAGELIFVGNHQEYLTELGKNTGNSGGLYATFDVATGTFQEYQSLSLPSTLNPRAITPIGEREYLISCNNSVQYILKR